jgi:hypothetical protein
MYRHFVLGIVIFLITLMPLAQDSPFAVITPDNITEIRAHMPPSRSSALGIEYIDNDTLELTTLDGIWSYNPNDLSQLPTWREFQLFCRENAYRHPNYCLSNLASGRFYSFDQHIYNSATNELVFVDGDDLNYFVHPTGDYVVKHILNPDNKLVILDAITLNEIFEITLLPNESYLQGDFNKDGTIFMFNVRSEFKQVTSTIGIWDLARQEKLAVVSGGGMSTQLVLSPNAQYIAVQSGGGFFGLGTGVQIIELSTSRIVFN